VKGREREQAKAKGRSEARDRKERRVKSEMVRKEARGEKEGG
jgi:hypothetical protein